MKKLAFFGFVLGMFAVMGAVAAADKDDPTGTWKFKTKFGKNETERTMKLEYKEGKLTGTVSGFGKAAKDTSIEDASFKDGVVKFSTTRLGGKDKDQKITTKYEGKLDGETIKGSITTDFGGKDNKTDWEAKREKPEEKKKD
jgi:hypothetical protein